MKFSPAPSGLAFLAALVLSIAPSFIASSPESSPANAQAEGALRWYDDLRTALPTARSARRWVLVDCYTDWCHWCKKLDADVFQNPNVVKQLGDHFIWVKCNTENASTGVWVKDKYGIQGYPCILILDPSGNVKGRIMGYLPPDAFVSRVAGILTH